MRRPIPETGEVWQCWKNLKQYEIIGINRLVPPDLRSIQYIHSDIAECTETCVVYRLVYFDKNPLDFWMIEPTTGRILTAHFVVYTADNYNWARPLPNFMSPKEDSRTGWRFWRLTAKPVISSEVISSETEIFDSSYLAEGWLS